jgi:DNA-directed RNA polymerase subunit M/transcription elongation factor TFIIS
MKTFLCCECGSPLYTVNKVDGTKRWDVYRCPHCHTDWDAIGGASGATFPSFMLDGREWRGPATRGKPKENVMTQGWVPVPEVNYDNWKGCPKPYCDTTGSSADAVVTCVCDNSVRVDKRGEFVAVCDQCGRVYRVKEKRSYTVEEYLGPER